MRRREAAGIAVLIAVAAAAAYAGAGGDPTRHAAASALADERAETPVVTCRTGGRIQGRLRLTRYVRRISTVAEPLVVWGTKRYSQRAFRPRPDGRLKRVKTPYLVKAGQTVVMTVVPPPGRHAELEIALEDAPYVLRSSSLELRSCPVRPPGSGGIRGGYVAFPAGFRLSGPMCLGIRVEVEGRAEPIEREIAFGRQACEPIVVTSRRDEYRPRCGPRQLGKRLRRYGRALHTVNAKALRRIWGRGFDWFGFTLRPPNRLVKSYDEGLRFLRRHGGLRVRFTEVELYRGGGVGLEGAFRSRKSGRRLLVGKAEFSCRRPTLKGGGIGTVKTPGNTANCPMPAEPVPKNAMIVCDRRAEARPSPER